MEMEREEEGLEEEECGGLKVRTRRIKAENQIKAGEEQVGLTEEVCEQERGVHFDETQGIESTDEIDRTEFRTVGGSPGEKDLGNKADFGTKNSEIQNRFNVLDHHQSSNNIGLEGQSSSFIYSEEYCENRTERFEPDNDGIETHAFGRPVRESNLEVMDVERVLEEQETHDLYCPNCNSCITKRVILRKRKRVVRDLKYDLKREKIQPVLPDLDASPVESAVGDQNDHTEPDIFRCLSCFCIFIRTASGFKLFPVFGRRDEGQNLQSRQQMPAKNANRIFSIFEVLKGKKTEKDPGDDDTMEDKEVAVETLHPSQTPGSSLLTETKIAVGEKLDDVAKMNGAGVPLPTKSHVDNGEQEEVPALKPSKDVLVMPNQGAGPLRETHIDTGEKLDSAIFAGNVKTKHVESDKIKLSEQIHITFGTQVEVSVPKPLENEKNMLILPKQEGSLDGAKQTDIGKKLEGAPKNNITGNGTQHVERDIVNFSSPSSHLGKTMLNDKNDTIILVPRAPLPENFDSDFGKQVEDPELKQLEDEKSSLIPAQLEVLLPGKAQADVGEKLDGAPKIAEDDEIQPIEESVVKRVTVLLSNSKSEISVSTAPNVMPVTETRIDMDDQRVEIATTHEWEVLKSIVYGGLIESITSLGVVSSAAGSDATTLNIVALGLANLIGGLFMIAHNLRGLKNDRHGVVDQAEERVGRYQEILGRRENFRLHAVVAVISYLIFGILPPLIYGFSFRKSDNKEYKLIAVAGASFACITLLATGKVYVQKAPNSYVKTIIYYVGIGVMASGISYVVGEELKRLIEKLGWFNSSEATTVLSSTEFPEMTLVKSGWASF
ncbi:membrane protein of ER body-like protein [Tasmannia lanceolata]|uniref:membrane protein of ER body-like protein n=1 Tax=Tasmannia lanceolata TaxID=3420 RepID=UPI0040635CDF